jgi:type IV secretory pathway VirB2 component (pilin)
MTPDIPRRLSFAIATLVTVAACSSSSTSTSSSSSGTTDAPCKVKATLSGSVSQTVAIGQSGSTLAAGDSCGFEVGIAPVDFTSGNIELGFSPEPAVGQTGLLAVVITIARTGDGGTQARWTTPAGACQLNITKSATDDTTHGKILDGQGSCNQAAAAVAGTSATGTVSVDFFSFHIQT